jgi:hypothetical protein
MKSACRFLATGILLAFSALATASVQVTAHLLVPPVAFNLLLKGSRRVNRILGPEEDLSDILAKSLRQARRQREL